ncbi:HD domain-containing protein [Actinomadura rupiterrae]|uniref:HD domain-containing protein n=1 Tax=Actinomadura rupiterrae TaxID=559627 RepID=UPI0020A57D75|nr:caspase family protein [Actinomadura rupiterrae]MCP2336786.1 hypothetical protein [Actinomadura rupiterrae]
MPVVAVPRVADRLALLIGVPACPEAASVLPGDLSDVVPRDVSLMADALSGSNYDLRVLGLDDDASGGRMRGELRRACQDAPAGGTLLIYFSGHGVHLNGADYLVPSDAQLSGPDELDIRTLLPLDLSEFLDQCPARTVLVVTDACREGPTRGFGAVTYPNASASLDVGFFFGCAEGQVCGSDEHGSFFTRALADALAPHTPTRTVERLVREATGATVRASAMQTPRFVRSSVIPDRLDAAEICDGLELIDRWRDAVSSSPLWDLASGPVDEIRTRVVKVVEEFARQRHDAMAALPDPWADDEYPVRVLEKGLLPLCRAELSPAEVAALVAVPFLREAVLAVGLLEARECEPLDLEAQPQASAIRTELESVHRAYQIVWRRASGRAPGSARDALAMWLCHRWLVERAELWRSSRPRELTGRLAAALLGTDAADWNADDLTELLLALGPSVGSDIVERHAGGELSPFPTGGVRMPGRADQPFRLLGLAVLLAFAGQLAADPRALPTVLADHVGIPDGVTPDDLRTTLTQPGFAWTPVGDDLDLQAVCPHPAVHAALEALMLRVDEMRQAIPELQAARGSEELAPAADLPSRFTRRGLRPRKLKGEPTYDVPLLRFRLADDEVRELLMGAQLYGERSLAIRELYQNALDACRYREMRLRYLSKTGAPGASWHGEIRITQGVDEDGRAFITCEDNGIGMAEYDLKHTFSRAGRRFEQTTQFRREQAQWKRKDPSLRLYPNSQFGIGVFSYFMLADEIAIETRRLNMDGHGGGTGLRVDVSSSGSLFRIRRSDQAVPHSGTRVTLYLPDDIAQSTSVLKTLGDLLKVAEYDVIIKEDDRKKVWPAGWLHYPPGGYEAGRPAVYSSAPTIDAPPRPPAVPPYPREFSTDDLPDWYGPAESFWWVNGHGAILADGLLANRRNFGYVADFGREHLPQMSVNRTQILAYDRRRLDELLRRGLEQLPQWQELTLAWLWRLALAEPSLAQAAVEALIEQNVVVAAGLQPTTHMTPVTRAPAPAWSPPVSLRAVGCLNLDAKGLAAALPDLSKGIPIAWLASGYFQPVPLSPAAPQGDFNQLETWVSAWRRVVHIEAGMTRADPEEDLVLPERVDGYPVPTPLEQVLLQEPEITLHRVAIAAGTVNRTMETALRRARRLAFVGRVCTRLPRVFQGPDFVPDRFDCSVLAWPDGRGAGARLTRARFCAILMMLDGMDVETFLKERLPGYRACGVPLTERDIQDAVASLTPEITHLIRDWVAVNQGLPRDGSLDERGVKALATHWGLSRRMALKRLAPLARIGLAVAHRTDFGPLLGSGRFVHAAPAPRAFAAVPAREIVDQLDAVAVTDLDVLRLAARYITSVRVVRERLNGLAASRGLTVPPPTEADHLRPQTPEMAALGLQTQADEYSWEQEGPSGNGRVTLGCLILAAAKTRIPISELRARLEQYRPLGIRFTEWSGKTDLVESLRQPDWQLLADSVDREWDGGPLPLRAILQLATDRRQTVSKISAMLASLGAQLGITYFVPILIGDFAELIPTHDELTMLERHRHRGLPTFLLARFAHMAHAPLGEVVKRFKHYEQLGEYRVWPGASPELPEDAAATRPDGYDVIALSEDLLNVEARSTPVDGLELVRIAGRFGWTLGRLWKRLWPYTFLGLELTAPEPVGKLAEHMPDWRELLLITRNLDGARPVAYPVPDDDHVDDAAFVVEESGEYVQERLRFYAPLFGGGGDG